MVPTPNQQRRRSLALPPSQATGRIAGGPPKLTVPVAGGGTLPLSVSRKERAEQHQQKVAVRRSPLSVPPSQLAALSRQNRELSVPSARYGYPQGSHLRKPAATSAKNPDSLPPSTQNAPETASVNPPSQRPTPPPAPSLDPDRTAALSPPTRLPTPVNPQSQWAAHQFAKGGTEEYASSADRLPKADQVSWLEFVPATVPSLRFGDL